MTRSVLLRQLRAALAPIVLMFVVVGNSATFARADLFVTGFFTGTVERFDEQTKARSIFATILGNPGLAGIVYNATNQKFYVSALNHGGVYVLDASGAQVGFHMLGYGPGGLTTDSAGNVVVTDFTSNNVRKYNPDFTTVLETIAVPAPTATGGVGYLSNGDLLISTLGAGIFRYSGGQVTAFTESPAGVLGTAQIAASPAFVYVGHGIGYSSYVYQYTTTGSYAGIIKVTEGMIGGTGGGSSEGTSPAGVAIDSSGNVIVAVLGTSNPGDPGGECGGLLKFSPTGTLLDTFITQSPAYSSVAIADIEVEEGTQVVGSFVYHNGWSGLGSAEDHSKHLHREQPTSQTLTFANLINTAKGINGVGFLISNLPNTGALTKNDFVFQVSPRGTFSQSEHPPSTWGPATQPGSLTITRGSPDKIVLTWFDNTIRDQWLRITIKANANTGLTAPAVFYLGHLRGETSSAANGVYSVSFDDLGAIRSGLGSTVGSDSILDINKDGSVNFNDISAARTAISSQLTNISVP